MVWIFFPVWFGFFITVLKNRDIISNDSVFIGFSIITAAFILSWQLFAIYIKGGKNSGENRRNN